MQATPCESPQRVSRPTECGESFLGPLPNSKRPNKVVFANDGRTMYVVDYGEVFTDFYKAPPFYTVPKSGVIWTISYAGTTH